MSYRVVIADDEALIRRDLAELLSSRGYRVVGEAADGAEALAMVERARPDLLILDIRMPVIDGIEVVRIVGRDLPVIMLTAHSSQDLIRSARDAGAMSYLLKPFREGDLEPAVELAVTHFLRESRLTEKVEALTQQLSARKVLERAKALLIEEHGLPEADAYRYLQKFSMDRNLTMAAAAQLVLDNAQGPRQNDEP